MSFLEEKAAILYENLFREFNELAFVSYFEELSTSDSGINYGNWPREISFSPVTIFREVRNDASKFRAFSPSAGKEEQLVIFRTEKAGAVMAMKRPASSSKPKDYFRRVETAVRLCMEFLDVEYRANHDALTGLYNHGYFQKTLREWMSILIKEFERARTQNVPLEENFGNMNLGLLIFDIDNFKSFNDIFGHKAGDAVLAEAASAVGKIVSQRRSTLTLCRYGGEEFAVITRGLSKAEVIRTGEAVRCAVENIDVAGVGRKINLAMKLNKITVSVGAAFYDIYTEFADFSGFFDVDANASRIVERADAALYSAKQLGKNRVVNFSDIASLCGSVYDRIGTNVLINLGTLHGINFCDGFFVYDSRYNGHSEVRSPETGKKIGVYPRHLKGRVKVSRDFAKFDPPLQERIALCFIEEEGEVAIAPNDKCVPAPRGERILYNDIFISGDPGMRSSFGVPENIMLGDFACLSLLNFGGALKELRYAEKNALENFLEKIRSEDFVKSLKASAFFQLSSDKAVICFKKRPSTGDIEAVSARAAAFIEKRSGLKLSVPAAVLMTDKRADGAVESDELLKKLRIADFCGRFYEIGSGPVFYSADIHRKYALFYYISADNEKAFETLLKCREVSEWEKDLKLLQNIGVIAMKLEKFDSAETFLRLAEKLEPSNMLVNSNLALLFSITGRYEEAVNFYKKLIKLDFNNAIFYNNVAYMMAVSGKKLKEARKYSLAALDKCDERQRPKFLDTLAMIYSKSGEHEDAALAYEKIIELQDDGAIEAHLNLARTYCDLGRFNSAWEVIHKISGHVLYPAYAADAGRILEIINRERRSAKKTAKD